MREEWINGGNADAHFQCSALTNASVEEAFSTVAELAYRHQVEAHENSLQMGQALNINALRNGKSNFKLGENAEQGEKAKGGCSC